MISKLRSGITGHVLVPFIDMGKLGEDKVFEELVKKTSVLVRLGLRYQLDVQVDLVRKQLNTWVWGLGNGQGYGYSTESHNPVGGASGDNLDEALGTSNI